MSDVLVDSKVVDIVKVRKFVSYKKKYDDIMENITNTKKILKRDRVNGSVSQASYIKMMGELNEKERQVSGIIRELKIRIFEEKK